MAAVNKPEIGYSHRGGYRPSVYINALDSVTGDDVARVVIGAGFALEADDSIEFSGDRSRVRIACESCYRGLGGGALRDTQEYDARRLRDVVKQAIRAAGFKPVKL